jgi:hypothetical protein
MKQIHLIAACALTLFVLAVTTYYQGRATERWANHNDSAELTAMAEKMVNIPLKVGAGDEWVGTIIEDTEESLAGYRAARVKAHVDVQYINSRTHEVMRVTLVCGHRRHVSRHTPDQCMIGAGFEPVDENLTFQASTDDVGVVKGRTMQFMKKGEEGVVNQRMIWTWSRDGRWVGPQVDNRVAFSAHPAWYKLYITMPISGSKTKSSDEDMKPFVRALMPALTNVLFPDGIGKAEDDDESVL